MCTTDVKKIKNPRLRDLSLPYHTARVVKCQLQKKGKIREKTKGEEEIAPFKKPDIFTSVQNRVLCFSLVAGQGLLQLQLLLAEW